MSVLNPPHRLIRPLYSAVGFALLGLGIVGVVTPGLPGTVFLILALWCFQRSNPRWEAWLLNHPRLGPPLREWDSTKSLRPRAKIMISGVIALFTLGSARGFLAVNPGLAVGIVVLGIIGVGFILTRPTLTDSTPRV